MLPDRFIWTLAAWPAWSRWNYTEKQLKCIAKLRVLEILQRGNWGNEQELFQVLIWTVCLKSWTLYNAFFCTFDLFYLRMTTKSLETTKSERKQQAKHNNIFQINYYCFFETCSGTIVELRVYYLALLVFVVVLS